MYGKEAMEAMLEGKTVRSIVTNRMYRIAEPTPLDLPTVMVNVDGEWVRSGMEICDWFTMPFEIVPEYDLTFFEAMLEIERGEVVSPECYSTYEYWRDDNGVLRYSVGGVTYDEASFTSSEIKSMWKVVE